MDYNVRHIDMRVVRCPRLFSGIRSMSNKNKKVASGGGSRSLLMTFMFLTAVAACGVSGYLFWEMKFAKPAQEAVEGDASAVPARSSRCRA